MDHARLSCSAVSSIAGVPFAEFTDFQPCSVTLTSKLAGVTSASRRGREGPISAAAGSPLLWSTVAIPTQPNARPSPSIASQRREGAAPQQIVSCARSAVNTIIDRVASFCAAIIAPDPGWWRVYRGADGPASRPPSLLFGRLSRQMARSHGPVTMARHMAHQHPDCVSANASLARPRRASWALS